jgi:transcriptional regulator
MYLPDHFRETDINEIKRIIQEFPLATLITSSSKGLAANHLPLLIEFKDNLPQRLLGHIAIDNPIYEDNNNNDDVLVVYKAEDSYVSPNWYPTKQKNHKVVPTWNYQSVHFYGKIKFLSDVKSLLKVVGNLTQNHEIRIGESEPWKIKDAPNDFIKEKLSNIIGIQIDIIKTMAKSKLSQNRELVDFNSVKTKMLEKNKKFLYKAMINKTNTQQN